VANSVQNAKRWPVSHQNIYLVPIGFDDGLPFSFGEVEFPIEILRPFTDPQNPHPAHFNDLKLYKVAHLLKFLALFLSFLSGVSILGGLSIENEIMVSRNHNFVWLRQLLNKLSKTRKLLFWRVHCKVSTVNQNIGLREFIDLYFSVHIVSIGKRYNFDKVAVIDYIFHYYIYSIRILLNVKYALGDYFKFIFST